MVVGMIIVGIIFFAGFGQAVHYLWNWLMPEIFGLHAISYWQAIGLLGLTWLLFGGFGWLGGPGRRHFRGGPMGRRLRHMTPEQRDTLLVHELAHLRRGDHWVRRLELLGATNLGTMFGKPAANVFILLRTRLVGERFPHLQIL